MACASINRPLQLKFISLDPLLHRESLGESDDCNFFVIQRRIYLDEKYSNRSTVFIINQSIGQPINYYDYYSITQIIYYALFQLLEAAPGILFESRLLESCRTSFHLYYLYVLQKEQVYLCDWCMRKKKKKKRRNTWARVSHRQG